MKNKQANAGSFATAKLQAKIRGFLAITLAVVIAFTFVACDDLLSLLGGSDGGGSGGGGGGGDSTSGTYTGTANGKTYSLKIIKAARDISPSEGDRYELTVGGKKSTGTVQVVTYTIKEPRPTPVGSKKSTGEARAATGDDLILKPNYTGAEAFNASVLDNGLTNVSGLITFDDGDEEYGPGPLDLVTPPSSGTAPAITTTSLPKGTVGTAYSQTLAATGATPITWSLFTGTLPAGLSLSSGGTISGIPTTSASYTFSVKATNTEGSDTKAFSITINASSTGGDPGTGSRPNPPTGLTITETTSSSITITWNAVPGATEYRLYRARSAWSGHPQVGSSPTNSYTDTGLDSNTEYHYFVTARNSHGESPNTSTIKGKTE